MHKEKIMRQKAVLFGCFLLITPALFSFPTAAIAEEVPEEEVEPVDPVEPSPEEEVSDDTETEEEETPTEDENTETDDFSGTVTVTNESSLPAVGIYLKAGGTDDWTMNYLDDSEPLGPGMSLEITPPDMHGQCVAIVEYVLGTDNEEILSSSLDVNICEDGITLYDIGD